jgi:hypothetical protein
MHEVPGFTNVKKKALSIEAPPENCVSYRCSSASFSRASPSQCAASPRNDDHPSSSITKNEIIDLAYRRSQNGASCRWCTQRTFVSVRIEQSDLVRLGSYGFGALGLSFDSSPAS